MIGEVLALSRIVHAGNVWVLMRRDETYFEVNIHQNEGVELHTGPEITDSDPSNWYIDAGVPGAQIYKIPRMFPDQVEELDWIIANFDTFLAIAVL